MRALVGVALIVGLGGGFALGWMTAQGGGSPEAPSTLSAGEPVVSEAPAAEPAPLAEAQPDQPATEGGDAGDAASPPKTGQEPAREGGARADDPPAPGASDRIARAFVTARLRGLLNGEPPEHVVDRAIELRRAQLDAALGAGVHQAAREELKRRDLAKLERAGEIGPLLVKLAEDPTPMHPLVGDKARFASVMAHNRAGPSAGAEALAKLAEQEEGTRIVLPEGKFSLLSLYRAGMPVGITIVGQGRDRTFLNGDAHMSGSLLGLTVEDLTVTDQDFVDIRSGTVTLTFRRCRMAGYNTGAGGSSFMDVRIPNFAIWCEDCTFDGTVGRSPDQPGPEKHGTPFSVSTKAKLLRFDGCTFIGNSTPVRLWGQATVHFENCTFRDNREALVRGAKYVNCRFEGNDDVPDGHEAKGR